MLKFAKDPKGDKYYRSVLEADNLAGEEYMEIANKKNLRGKMSHARTKFRIAKLFELGSPREVTMEQIVAYCKKDIHEIVRNSTLLKDGRISAINNDRFEREYPKQAKAFTSFGHRAVMRDVFVEVQNITSISHADVLRRAKEHVDNEAQFAAIKRANSSNSRVCRDAAKTRKKRKDELRWLVSIEQIDALANYVKEKIDDINLFFGSNFKNPTAPETKTKVFNTIMGHLGIEVKKSPKRKGEDQPEYFIDYDRVAELVATKNLTQLLGP